MIPVIPVVIPVNRPHWDRLFPCGPNDLPEVIPVIPVNSLKRSGEKRTTPSGERRGEMSANSLGSLGSPRKPAKAGAKKRGEPENHWDHHRDQPGSPPPQNRTPAGPTTLTVVLPFRTKNMANSRENPHAKARRVKAERKATGLFFLVAGWPSWKLRQIFAAGCTVTFTRFGPQLIDDDGLPTTAKAIRDELASMLGQDDSPRNRLLRWRYRQETGRYAVHVHLETFTPPELP